MISIYKSFVILFGFKCNVGTFKLVKITLVKKNAHRTKPTCINFPRKFVCPSRNTFTKPYLLFNFLHLKLGLLSERADITPAKVAIIINRFKHRQLKTKSLHQRVWSLQLHQKRIGLVRVTSHHLFFLSFQLLFPPDLCNIWGKWGWGGQSISTHVLVVM